MCSKTTFGCCKLALITANARGMASGRMVVGLRCWVVLDIEQVTSATWWRRSGHKRRTAPYRTSLGARLARQTVRARVCAASCAGGQAAQRSKTERGSGTQWIDDN